MYDILGSLEAMAGWLPQACRQLARWLDHEAESNRLRVPEGLFAGDVPGAVATASHWLQQAEDLAERLRVAFSNGHEVASGLAYDEEGSGEVIQLQTGRTVTAPLEAE